LKLPIPSIPKIAKEHQKNLLILLLLGVITLLFMSKGDIVISRNFTYGMVFFALVIVYYINQQKRQKCLGYIGRIDHIREHFATGVNYQYALENFSKEGVESMAIVPNQRYLMGFVKSNIMVTYDSLADGGVDEVRFVQLSDYKDELEKSELMREVMKDERKKQLEVIEMEKRGFSKDEAERKVYEDKK